jgi:hypothetical protein
VSALHSLAQRCKRFSPLLAVPAALLLAQGEARALLTYNIYESGGNVVVQASGSLNLTALTSGGLGQCGPSGAIVSSVAAVCTGSNSLYPYYSITGPSSFNGTVNALPASSVSGIFTFFNGSVNEFAIDSSYLSNTPIVGSATFNGTTLAALGFTTTSGLIGTWTLNGSSEKIQVILGSPPPAAVPSPLPLLGAGAAFGWARRLRKRTQLP